MQSQNPMLDEALAYAYLNIATGRSWMDDALKNLKALRRRPPGNTAAHLNVYISDAERLQANPESLNFYSAP